IGEVEAEGADRQPRIVRRRARERHQPQRLDRQHVPILGVERAHQRAGQAIEQVEQERLRLCCPNLSPRKIGCERGPTQGYNSYRRNPLPQPGYSPVLRMPMLTHHQIWSAIDRLAERNDLSPSGLAKKAGLDPTTFNKSKRVTPEGRDRWPSTESIAKALQATSTKVDAFVKLITEGSKASIQHVPLIGF